MALSKHSMRRVWIGPPSHPLPLVTGLCHLGPIPPGMYPSVLVGFHLQRTVQMTIHLRSWETLGICEFDSRPRPGLFKNSRLLALLLQVYYRIIMSYFGKPSLYPYSQLGLSGLRFLFPCYSHPHSRRFMTFSPRITKEYCG